MTRRIAFLISDQHLIPHGGIGQFAKGFCEMAAANGCIVDLVLDQRPTSLFFEPNGLTLWPERPMRYRGHTEAFAFEESYNLERSLNFRDALLAALRRNPYDLIIINTAEALLGSYGLGLHEQVQQVFYTHNENLVFKQDRFKGVFNDVYDEFFGKLMSCRGVTVGTQTQRNVDELAADGLPAALLPMPMPERSILKPYEGEKRGLLFIGRWEERKDPEEFIRVAKLSRLPVKVMTTLRSVPRFQAAFDKAGLEHDVRGGIVGEEKADFIRSSKVFYMPSKSESYGFALFEALGHCHVVTLDEYSWTANWPSRLVHRTNRKNAAYLCGKLYEEPLGDAGLQYAQAQDAAVWPYWRALMDGFTAKRVDTPGSRMADADDFYYDGFLTSLNRRTSVEDIRSALNSRHRFHLTYSKDRTWCSKLGVAPGSYVDPHALFAW